VSEDPDKSGAIVASEARGAELREELAATDERRAEEERSKAQDASAAAQQEESKQERERLEAEERRQAAAAEAERAREDARATQPNGAGLRTYPPVEGPEKPELYVAAAFAGAFLFARILKQIAE
jgi:hypothetical protein